MSADSNPPQPTQWECARCGVPLETAKVRVDYLDSAYPVDLEKCPVCGQVWVPEPLALGKMAEVEKALEDK